MKGWMFRLMVVFVGLDCVCILVNIICMHVFLGGGGFV